MKYIALHHSITPQNMPTQRSLKIIEETHIKNFDTAPSLLNGSRIGYNFTIAGDGTINSHRKIGEETTAQKGYNFDAVSICMLLNGDKEMPNPKMLESLRTIIAGIRKTQGNIPLYPHRWFTGNGSLCQFKNDTSKQTGCPHKSCCGLLMSDSWVNINFNTMSYVEPIAVKQDIILACNYGDTGANIYTLQKRLVKEDCMHESFITGNYDDRTCDAVLGYQNKYNISTVLDRYLLKGKFVGPKTLKVLNA